VVHILILLTHIDVRFVVVLIILCFSDARVGAQTLSGSACSMFHQVDAADEIAQIGFLKENM
jgi:hypothetical protein